MGMTYPPSIQYAHYLALQSAFAARVKGDLQQKTGWGTALLFATDAIIRVVADLGPNLSFSADQIARALDPSIELPGVAAVVSAIARYAALAKDKPLAAIVSAAQSTPERGAAREALRKAISGMGAPGEAPVQLADDITTLADGLIATLTVRLHAKAPPAGTCAADTKTAEDIEIEHALTKLRAVRQKILQSPRLKSGNTLWTRRARLLVTLLSDGMDFAAPLKSGKKRTLTLTAKQVEESLSAALADWAQPGGADTVVGLYSLVRFFLAADADTRFEGGGPYLVRALGGIGRFLRSGASAESPTMLDALAQLSGREGGPDDIASALVAYARSFYDKAQPDQGDLFLLGTLLISSVRRTPPPREALALAAQHKSRIEWAMSLFAQVAAAETTGRPDPLAFAAGMRAVTEAQCSAGRPDDVLSVLGAVTSFTAGKRKEARATLDKVLDRAAAEGLVIPKLNYQYTEKHDSKVFNISFGLTQGAGFVEGGHTFQIGLGLSTLAERSSKLTVAAATPSETATETARWYVRVAGLAAAYHFLDGDPVSGASAARRAVAAIVSGVRLGPRSITEERDRWAREARPIFALDAQLASDAAMPFLSGDLWTIVKQSLPADFNDKDVDGILSEPPTGLAGVKDAEAPMARAAKVLRVVAGPLACTGAKVDTAQYEKPSCDTYPLALSLRIADVLTRMPRLAKPPAKAPPLCAAFSELDAFLASAERGSYDPDAFTAAVGALRAADRADEATSLMARQRRDAHCNPTLLKAARELGRSPALTPWSRADMLVVAVNCTGAAGAADLESDLKALDDETRKLADPMRNLKVLLFAAELSLRADKPQLLLSLVRAPSFLDRFLRMHGNAVAGALLLHHTAHLLAAEPFDPAQTEGPFSLVCGAFPAADRRIECDDLKALRAPGQPAPPKEARQGVPRTPPRPRRLLHRRPRSPSNCQSGSPSNCQSGSPQTASRRGCSRKTATQATACSPARQPLKPPPAPSDCHSRRLRLAPQHDGDLPVLVLLHAVAERRAELDDLRVFRVVVVPPPAARRVAPRLVLHLQDRLRHRPRGRVRQVHEPRIDRLLPLRLRHREHARQRRLLDLLQRRRKLLLRVPVPDEERRPRVPRRRDLPHLPFVRPCKPHRERRHVRRRIRVRRVRRDVVDVLVAPLRLPVRHEHDHRRRRPLPLLRVRDRPLSRAAQRRRHRRVPVRALRVVEADQRAHLVRIRQRPQPDLRLRASRDAARRVIAVPVRPEPQRHADLRLRRRVRRILKERHERRLRVVPLVVVRHRPAPVDRDEHVQRQRRGRLRRRRASLEPRPCPRLAARRLEVDSPRPLPRSRAPALPIAPAFPLPAEPLVSAVAVGTAPHAGNPEREDGSKRHNRGNAELHGILPRAALPPSARSAPPPG
ncbi:MAG: hypothetical protein R3F14_17830 [Polyangiaceae bacterium]